MKDGGAFFFRVCCVLDVLELATIFSSHPQITADSYIQSIESQSKTSIIQRSRFEMDIQPGTNMDFFSVTAEDCVNMYFPIHMAKHIRKVQIQIPTRSIAFLQRSDGRSGKRK